MGGYSPYYYYSGLFTIMCSCLSTGIGFKNRYRFEELRYIYLYPLVSFLQLIVAYFVYSSNLEYKTGDLLIMTSANIFMLTEFLVIYHFFSQVLKSRQIKKIMQIITWIYLIITITDWIFKEGFIKFPVDAFILQAVCILIPVFVYFFELFKNPVIPKLQHEPSFWIAIGIVFYFACTLPLFLMKNFIFSKDGLIQEDKIYSINFICYGILFLLITKAYLCRKRNIQ